MAASLKLTGVFLLALALNGCLGYRAGDLLPAGIDSVNVQVAGNETFWRTAEKVQNLAPAMVQPTPRPAGPMEVTLSERLAEEIVRRTALQLEDAATADSILETKITDVTHATLQRDGKDNLIRGRVEVAVSFVWRDRRTGRIIARADNVRRPTEYGLERHESFTTAARRSFDYVAERIVENMQEGF
jgi:hypothetical protein